MLWWWRQEAAGHCLGRLLKLVWLLPAAAAADLKRFVFVIALVKDRVQVIQPLVDSICYQATLSLLFIGNGKAAATGSKWVFGSARLAVEAAGRAVRLIAAKSKLISKGFGSGKTAAIAIVAGRKWRFGSNGLVVEARGAVRLVAAATARLR